MTNDPVHAGMTHREAADLGRLTEWWKARAEDFEKALAELRDAWADTFDSDRRKWNRFPAAVAEAERLLGRGAKHG